MKNFMKWKIWGITCLACLLPIVAGLILWDKLPSQMAVHFDINNNPDKFASKGFAVFALPCLMVLLQTVCCIINDVNAKKFGERKKFAMVTKWIIPVISVLLYGLTLAYALDAKIDIRRWAIVIVGVVFIAIGNYLPKFDQIKDFKGNHISGEKARKANRFIGFGEVIMGILAIVTAFLPPLASIIWLFLLIPYALICVIYAIKVTRG